MSLLSFIIILGVCLSSQVWAQVAPAVNAQGQPIQNCDRPRNKSERYQCFVTKFNETQQRSVEAIERAKELVKKTPYEKQQKELLDLEEERLKEKELLQQRALRSRVRNVSRKGQPYNVTYGKVTEPRRDDTGF